jgi:hypothetical protein
LGWLWPHDCHPERSEGSGAMTGQILHCVQNDKRVVLVRMAEGPAGYAQALGDVDKGEGGEDEQDGIDGKAVADEGPGEEVDEGVNTRE